MKQFQLRSQSSSIHSRKLVLKIAMRIAWATVLFLLFILLCTIFSISLTYILGQFIVEPAVLIVSSILVGGITGIIGGTIACTVFFLYLNEQTKLIDLLWDIDDVVDPNDFF